MKVFKCDRCGNSYIPKEQFSKYVISERVIKDEGWRGYQYVDLCPDCYSDFLTWLKL